MDKIIRKQNFLLLIFCFISFLFPSSVFAFGESQSIRYSVPTWLDNENLLCVKHIKYYKKGFGILADISKGRVVLVKEEIQLCSMKIDGSGEKVIKNILVTHNPRRWQNKEFEGVLQIDALSYNRLKNLITISTHNGIYLMNLDGTNVKRLLENGYLPRLSPDGNWILYTGTDNSLWLIDTDGKNNYKLIDNAGWGLWHPSGEKVYFYRSPDIYEYDLKTKKENKLFSTWYYLEDIYPDGTKILAGSMYDLSLGKAIFIKALQHGLNYYHFSPDGKKIVGDPVNVEGSICIVDIEGTNFKVLR